MTNIEKDNWYYIEKNNFIGDDDYISYIEVKLQDYTDIEAYTNGANDNKEFSTSASQRIEMLKCAEIPTSEKYCKKDLYYNSQEQELTEAPEEGYQFYDNKKKEAGTFPIPAKLNSGYIWTDGNSSDKYIECTIQNRIYKIQLNPGEQVTTTGTTMLYEIYHNGMYINNNYSADSKMSSDKNPITKPTKSNYTFKGYYTGTNGSGKQIITSTGHLNSEFNATDFSADSTLYAYWTENSYTLTYNNQSGSGCSTKTFTPGNKFSNYNCTPTRTNYDFEGWYTSTGGSGTKYTSTTTMPSKNLTLYANWEASYSDTINGERCIGTTKYYITYCQPQSIGTGAKCKYNKKNGVSSSGTVTRQSLTMCSSSGTTTTSDYTQAKMVSGTWYIYKKAGYVHDSTCSISLYQYGSSSPIGCGDASLVTQYAIGSINNKTVYLKTNSSGNPSEIAKYPISSSKSKIFIKIYIKSTEFTADVLGPLGGDESKLTTINAGSATINGTKYYAVWIAETCNKSQSTCNPTGTSLTSIKW